MTRVPLTYVHNIDVHGVGKCSSQSVGGHNSDVVVDPNGRVVLVEEAGVLPAREVIGTLVHGVRTGKNKNKKKRKENGMLI